MDAIQEVNPSKLCFWVLFLQIYIETESFYNHILTYKIRENETSQKIVKANQPFSKTILELALLISNGLI